MKTYSIISPSIDGVLSDDYLYFEGVRKPLDIYKIRDKEITLNGDINTLERYSNDVYNLFLRKLSLFISYELSTDEEILKMQALLQELIKVRALISKTDNK